MEAAILAFIGGIFLGGSVGFIFGYREGGRTMQDWFEKKLAEMRAADEEKKDSGDVS